MPIVDIGSLLRASRRVLEANNVDTYNFPPTVIEHTSMPRVILSEPVVANGIAYPAGNHRQAHVHWNEQRECFFIRLFNMDGSLNDNYMSQNLNETYAGCIRHVQYTIPGGTVFPPIGSDEQQVLYRCAIAAQERRAAQEREDQEFMNEDRMPITSRTPTHTQHSFIISWDGRHGCYTITPPLDTATVSDYSLVSLQQISNLDTAYRNALSYAYSYRRHSTLGAPYHVWPRRNSNAYRNLIDAPNSTNPTNIPNYDSCKSIISCIANEPTDPNNEGYTRDLFMYLLYKRYGNMRMYPGSAIHEVQTEIALLLFKKTGVAWLKADDTNLTYVHPDNVILVHTDVRHLEYTQVYSTRGRISECGSCTGCSNWFYRRSIVKPNRQDETIQLCLNCLDASGWYKCSLCDNKYHHEDVGCPEYARMPVGHIYNYSQDVRAVVPKMFNEVEDVVVNGSHLRYGVELEVFYRDGLDQSSVRNTVGNAIKGHAIMKHDSSLAGRGFEIVTAPATLAYHRKQLWNKFFTLKDTNNRTAAQSVWAWNTKLCGLHVHITRAAMTEMQLAKLCVFYHDSVNGAFLSKIAGREVGPNARYCKALKKKLYYKKETGEGTINDCRSHHDAITISDRNHGKTAEIRIFRANATRHGIMRAIEFVDATVAWCGQNGATGLTFPNFLKWFDSPTVRTKYPDLWRHLIEMRYLTTKHKPSDKHTAKKPKYTGDKAQKLAPLEDTDKVA